MFGDIHARVRDEHLWQVEMLQEKFKTALNGQVASGASFATACEKLGKDFMREAWSLCDELDPKYSLPYHAWCFNHGKACNFFKPAPEAALSLCCAGPTCVDWSTLGSKYRWLGGSAITFIFWLREVMRNKNHIVVIENVEHFDYQVVTELVKELYSVEVFQMDPRDFGMPVSRRRLYVVLFLKSMVRWIPEVRDNPVGVLKKLFARPLRMDGSIFYCAPQRCLRDYFMEFAKKKSLPALQQTGEVWPCKLLLNKASRNRVREWESMLGSVQLTLLVEQSASSFQCCHVGMFLLV